MFLIQNKTLFIATSYTWNYFTGGCTLHARDTSYVSVELHAARSNLTSSEWCNPNVLYGDVILFTFACWLAKGKLSSLASIDRKGNSERCDSMYVVVSEDIYALPSIPERRKSSTPMA
jgi:hypothetical protein